MTGLAQQAEPGGALTPGPLDLVAAHLRSLDTDDARDIAHELDALADRIHDELGLSAEDLAIAITGGDPEPVARSWPRRARRPSGLVAATADLEPPDGYLISGTAVGLPSGGWIEAQELAKTDIRHEGRCPVLAAWMHALAAWQAAALAAGFRGASPDRLEARAAIRDGAVIVYVYEGGADKVGPASVRGGSAAQRIAVLARLRALGLCAQGYGSKAAGLRWLPIKGTVAGA